MQIKNFFKIDFFARRECASASRLSLWLGLVVVILCAAYASYSRLGQLSAWQYYPERYVASGVPMMTTLDAYYSLRLARLHAAGKFIPWGPAPQRHYSRPDPENPSEWVDQREPKFLPLLSRMLADAAIFFGGDIDRTALVLSPLLGSLFMIPLFWYCWRIGVPGAGLMGGLVGTFCLQYYQRTGVGWNDTDCLNLFFPWTVSCLILAMRGESRRQTLLLLSAAAGALLYIFYLWYEKAGLTFAYLCALVIHLSLAGVSWRRIVLCAATLIVFANPVQMADASESLKDFVDHYLWPSAATTTDATLAIRFPQVWSTIGEDGLLSWPDTLKQILSRPEMSLIGLSAFAFFSAWRWRVMPALSPLLFLAVLPFVSARRFIFYLAPFVGIGWGVIVSSITRATLNRLGQQSDETVTAPQISWSSDWLRAATLQIGVVYGAIIVVFFAWFAPASSKLRGLRPAIPAQVFRNLQILGKQLPANSRMWTWWDNGFAIVDATGFGVYHDGAAQYTPQTNLIARTFIDSDNRVMHEAIAFVDREGNQGIRRMAATADNFDDLVTRLRRVAAPPPIVPVYVLYTADMLAKFWAMRFLGAANDGVAAQRGTIAIRRLPCEWLDDEKAYCSGQAFDLRTGAIEQHQVAPALTAKPVSLRRAVMIEGGHIVRQRDYTEKPDNAQLTLEIFLRDGILADTYLLDESAFRSNLNQMFALGRYDGTLFEEVYNNFPHARAFKVRSSSK